MHPLGRGRGPLLIAWIGLPAGALLTVASSLLAPRWGAIAHLVDVLGIGLLAAGGAVILHSLLSRSSREPEGVTEPERVSAAVLAQASERLLSAAQGLAETLESAARESVKSSAQLERAVAALGYLAERKRVESEATPAALWPQLEGALKEVCDRVSLASRLLERSLGELQLHAERMERGYGARLDRARAPAWGNSAEDTRGGETERGPGASLTVRTALARICEARRVTRWPAETEWAPWAPSPPSFLRRLAMVVTGRVGRVIRPGSRREGSREDRSREEVDCGVFAPPSAAAGTSLLVQVFAYTPEHVAAVQAMAVQFDETARPRSFATLETQVAHGSTLVFHLLLPGMVIDDPVRKVTWRGRPTPVQFSVFIPEDCPLRTTIGTVLVSQDSVPVGHIKFRLEVVASASAASQVLEPMGEQAKLYQLAFVSYAKEDRRKVMRRVPMLRAVGIQYFLDAVRLSPGDRWEREIYRHIDECDLFLLFWSRAASQSEWVLKETRYALQRKSGDDLAPPEIRPVIIEGPPVPPPPPDLAHLHFDDPLLYFIGA